MIFLGNSEYLLRLGCIVHLRAEMGDVIGEGPVLAWSTEAVLLLKMTVSCVFDDVSGTYAADLLPLLCHMIVRAKWP